MLINKLLSETNFKVNQDFFGLPLFFLVSSEEDMLKMMNSVCHTYDDIISYFGDYIKKDFITPADESDEDIDTTEYYISTSIKPMKDAVYNSYGVDEITLEPEYETLFIEEAEFTFEFSEPLVFFVNFCNDFDRFGEVATRQVYHCKFKDLLNYKLALPEPTYFQNI